MAKTKSRLLLVLTVCLVSCFALFFTGLKPQTVSADVDVSTILMDEGASVRLKVDGANADKNGIRFILFVNAEWYDGLAQAPEIGMFISRVSDIDVNNEYTSAAEIPANAMHFIAEQFTGDSDRTAQETKSFSAVIYDIPASDFGTSLIANGYYKLAGEETLHFAANPQIRSVAQVASRALVEGNETGDNLDILLDYVDNVVDGNNFKFAKAQVNTDMYKTNVNLGVTLPENLSAVWASSDTTVATVDGAGNVTRTGKYGDTTISATIGSTTISTTFNVGDPAPLKVNAYNADSIYLQTSGELYAGVPETTEADSFGGVYTGNSIKIKEYTSYYAYAVKNEYSIAELTAIKNDGYGYVSFYVSCSEIARNLISFYNEVQTLDPNGVAGLHTVASKLGMNNDNANKFIPTAAERTYGKEFNTENWYKLEITIDTYIDLVNDGGTARDFCPIWSVWDWDIGTEPYFYFGDITFEKYPALAYSDFGPTTRQNKYEWAADGITGSYSGTALKSAGINSNYSMVNPWTAEQLTALKATYTTVTLNIAFKFTGSGAIRLYGAANGDYGFVGLDVGEYTDLAISNSNVGVWLSISVSIDDYIDLVARSSYANFKVFQQYAWDIDNLSIYFGELTLS